MKKALLIKLESHAYSSIGMERAFKEHFEVRSIDWHSIRFNNGYNGLNVIWDTILKECAEFEPDLIFAQFQVFDILKPEQFKKLSELAFVINYTEDVREDTSWYEAVAPHIGLTIFTNIDDVEKLKAKGISNVAYMPVSYNDVWYRPVSKTDKYYGDIVFIGTNYTVTNMGFPCAQERQDMIKFMKDKFGEKFHSYGLGQEYQMLLPNEVIEAYNNAKIVITHNSFSRKGYCSDRGLNAMGCGAVVLHQYFDGINDLLGGVMTMLTWHNFTLLENRCKSFLDGTLSMNREEISKYTKENHSWHRRVVELMGIIDLMVLKLHPKNADNEVYQPPLPRNEDGSIKNIRPYNSESELYHYKQ